MIETVPSDSWGRRLVTDDAVARGPANVGTRAARAARGPTSPASSGAARIGGSHGR